MPFRFTILSTILFAAQLSLHFGSFVHFHSLLLPAGLIRLIKSDSCLSQFLSSLDTSPIGWCPFRWLGLLSPCLSLASLLVLRSFFRLPAQFISVLFSVIICLSLASLIGFIGHIFSLLISYGSSPFFSSPTLPTKCYFAQSSEHWFSLFTLQFFCLHSQSFLCFRKLTSSSSLPAQSFSHDLSP